MLQGRKEQYVLVPICLLLMGDGAGQEVIASLVPNIYLLSLQCLGSMVG